MGFFAKYLLRESCVDSIVDRIDLPYGESDCFRKCLAHVNLRVFGVCRINARNCKVLISCVDLLVI